MLCLISFYQTIGTCKVVSSQTCSDNEGLVPDDITIYRRVLAHASLYHVATADFISSSSISIISTACRKSHTGCNFFQFPQFFTAEFNEDTKFLTAMLHQHMLQYVHQLTKNIYFIPYSTDSCSLLYTVHLFLWYDTCTPYNLICKTDEQFKTNNIWQYFLAQSTTMGWNLTFVTEPTTIYTEPSILLITTTTTTTTTTTMI